MTEEKKLLIATRNKHKLAEIRAITAGAGIILLSTDDVPGLPEVVEDGDTFEKNAVKKAVTLALCSRLWSLADDSGLEVDALYGAPGIHSARYAGDSCDCKANNAKLLEELAGITERCARFRCVIALASPDGTVQAVEGKCEGSIALQEEGSEGFGYDPLFVPDGYDKPFATLSADQKNKISHRGAALRAAARKWPERLGGA